MISPTPLDTIKWLKTGKTRGLVERVGEQDSMIQKYTKKEDVNSVGSKLFAVHHKAIELRYMGNTYRTIADEITKEFGRNHSDFRVRRWFARGGICDQPYMDYAKKENERRRAAVMEELKKITPKIPMVIDELLERVQRAPFTGAVLQDSTGKQIKKLDMVTVQSLKLLVEMLGFKVSDGNADGNPADDYFDKAEAELKKT